MSDRFWLSIDPENIGGPEYNRWKLSASTPYQTLTESYDDFLEMKERVDELLRRYRERIDHPSEVNND